MLSFRPTQGLIPPQCHQIIVVMLENNYCLPDESENEIPNNENNNNNANPSTSLNEDERVNMDISHDEGEKNIKSQKETKNETVKNSKINNNNNSRFLFKKYEVNVSKLLHIRINDDEKNDQVIKCNISYQKPVVLVGNGESSRWKCGSSFNNFCEESDDEEDDENEADCNNCNNIEEISINLKISKDNLESDSNNCSNIEKKSENEKDSKDATKCPNKKKNLANMNSSNKNLERYQQNNNFNNNVIDTKKQNMNNNANCGGSSNTGFMSYIFSRPTNTGNSSSSQSTMINPCLSSVEYRWIIPKKCEKYLKVHPEKDVLKPFELKVFLVFLKLFGFRRFNQILKFIKKL